jgi:O-acetyl-ADP-ribose deacetylase (regulator of RNase III)
MDAKCPLYLQSSECTLKLFSNPRIVSFFLKQEFPVLQEKWNLDCEGNLSKCSFSQEQEKNIVQVKVEETTSEPIVEPKLESTRVSIHKVENPYLVKSDALVYPTNIGLTIDDPLLNRMSRGRIQSECDKFSKPIKMGTVYITSNGNGDSKVKPQKIYHAVVAGESRLVNEADTKLAIKKALIIANQDKVRNIVMLPSDCGTLDINDAARVQLSAVKTFLSTEKDCTIKNIFLVMEDEDSYNTYEEYYNRIFA